jgi:hypothetical protein
MNEILRIALHELVHAPSLDVLRENYRKLEHDPLNIDERESVALVFNQLVHHWATETTHTP